jgi:galactokinase
MPVLSITQKGGEAVQLSDVIGAADRFELDDAFDMRGAFQKVYGVAATGVVSAPGRVNLIGEHTDYNQGFVLPCALEFHTRVAFRPRADSRVQVTSLNYGLETVRFDFAQRLHRGPCDWVNYIVGVYDVLLKLGHRLRGADLLIMGNVPQGAGLSSSAALEVAVGGALNAMNECGLSPQDIARIGQQTENDFLDCQTGIMDQMVSACARQGHALLLDCEDLSTQQIPMVAGYELLIINSNVKRSLVGSEYNQRRLDCETAAKTLGIPSLRHASVERLQEGRTDMSENAYRRALHVITENERTCQAAEALARNDFSTLRELMYASHDSLRDYFEVTVPETDFLVDLIRSQSGDAGAARMTGGGFGGAVVALVEPALVETVSQALREAYPRTFGLQPDIYRCRTGNGMRLE